MSTKNVLNNILINLANYVDNINNKYYIAIININERKLMCIKMRKSGAPVKWDTSDLLVVGDKKIFPEAKSTNDCNGIRMNGKNAGKRLSVKRLVGDGAIAELVEVL